MNQQIVDRQSFRSHQIRLAVFCGFVLFMAGFNAQEIGYIIPAIIEDWRIEREAFGAVLASGLLGMMIGAMVFGPMADRIGRPPVLLVCTLAFGICACVTSTASSIGDLSVWRFLTGLGVGGALPNAIALTSENTPRRTRSTVTMLMFCGFSFGAAVAGFSAAGLIRVGGWKSVFLLGGTLPCLTAVPLFIFLRQSLRHVPITAADRGARAKTLASLTHTAHSVSSSDSEKPSHHFLPVAALFKEGRAVATPLLWVIFFMSLLVLHFVTAWLPTIVRDAGIDLESAVLITTMFQMGALGAAYPLGRILDRPAPFQALGFIYFGAGILVVLIGLAGTSVPFLFAASFGAGFFILGGQLGANALAASLYPTSMRATGIGWALGVGRLGSIVGPVIGAWLLGLELETKPLFMLAAVPVTIAALAALGMHRVWGDRGMTEARDASSGHQ